VIKPPKLQLLREVGGGAYERVEVHNSLEVLSDELWLVLVPREMCLFLLSSIVHRVRTYPTKK